MLIYIITFLPLHPMEYKALFLIVKRVTGLRISDAHTKLHYYYHQSCNFTFVHSCWQQSTEPLLHFEHTPAPVPDCVFDQRLSL
jgi:hypothetical protein